jgi:drug/metabolite transporter (DMT)-like permease
MVAAAAAFVTNDTFVKLAGTDVPVGQTIAVRGAMSLVLVYALCLWFGQRPALPHLVSRHVLWRAGFDLVSTFMFIAALMHMPIANLTSIIQAVPLAVVVLAVLFLGERVGWRRVSAIIAGFLGVLLIAKPAPSTFTIYEGMALAIVVTAAMRDIATRRIPPQVPSLVVAFANALFVTLGGLATMPVEGYVAMDVPHVLYLAAAAAFLALGYTFMVLTVRLGEITATAPFRYVNVLFSIFSGLVVFGEVPDGWAFAGMALIVASGLYALHRDAVVRRNARTRSP